MAKRKYSLATAESFWKQNISKIPGVDVNLTLDREPDAHGCYNLFVDISYIPEDFISGGINVKVNHEYFPGDKETGEYMETRVSAAGFTMNLSTKEKFYFDSDERRDIQDILDISSQFAVISKVSQQFVKLISAAMERFNWWVNLPIR